MPSDPPKKFSPGNPTASRPVKKLTGECVSFEDDLLAVEEPLEIRVGGASISVTMRTPGSDKDLAASRVPRLEPNSSRVLHAPTTTPLPPPSDDASLPPLRLGTRDSGPGTSSSDIELAAGFCLTEGIVLSPDEIESIQPCPDATHGNIIDVTLAPEARDRNTCRVSDAKRQLYLSSSCGLCGRQTIDRVFQNIPPINSTFQIPRATLDRLPDRLREAQPTFNKTGGLHGVALFDAAGNLLLTREDIGRHNAVDKVIGHQALLNRWPLANVGLLVSGRAGFEIIQKAAIAGIPLIAAVGAPSSLAVDACLKLNITLVGFLRPNRMNIYTGDRIT